MVKPKFSNEEMSEMVALFYRHGSARRAAIAFGEIHQPVDYRLILRGVLLFGRGAGLLFPWPSLETYPKFVRVCGISIVIFIMYKCVCTTYAIMTIDKFEVRIYLMAALSYFLTSLLHVLFSYLRGDELRSLLSKVDSTTELLLSSGLGDLDHFQVLYQNAASRLGKFSRFMLVSALFCPLMFCISVPLLDLGRDEYRSRTAVPNQCPIELQYQHDPGIFELIVTLQILAYTIPSIQKIVTEIIMLSLFNIQTAIFSYLSLSLNKMSRDLAANVNERAAWEKFYVWMRLHQRAVSLFDDTIKLFSPVVVMYYLLTIVTVAGSLLYMTDTDSSNIIQSLFGGGYMVMILFSLFLQCQAADEVTTQAQNIADEIYCLPWYNFDSRRNSIIKFILKMSIKPMYVDAYRSPAFRLSKKAYHTLFVNTVSAYMGFRKIMDIQHASNQ